MNPPVTHPDEGGQDNAPANRSQARTAGLKRSAQARTLKAEHAVGAAIRDLLKTGAPINFTSVARVAGVSKAFLHRHPELSERIRQLGSSQIETLRDQRAPATGEASVIAALRRKLKDQETAHVMQVRELRERIKELEAQVAALYGKM